MDDLLEEFEESGDDMVSDFNPKPPENSWLDDFYDNFSEQFDL